MERGRPRLLDRLPELIAGLEVVRLDENHRSTPQVVAAAAAALGPSAAATAPLDGPRTGPCPW